MGNSDFHPPIGRTSNGGSIVPFTNTLYYLFPDENANLWMAFGDLTALVENNDFDQLCQDSAWRSVSLASSIGNKNGANLATNYRPAMVLVQSTKLEFPSSVLYLFWADTASNQVYATSYNLSAASWARTTYVVQDASGKAIKTNSTVSVIKVGRKLKLSWFDTSAVALDSSLLDPTKIGTSSWRADSNDSPVQLAGVKGLDADSSYNNMSTAFFSQGNAGDYMVAAFYSTSKRTIQSFIVPLTRDPEGKLPVGARADGTVMALDSFAANRGVDLVAEPSGRIGCFYGMSSGNDALVALRTLDTYADPRVAGALSWGEPDSSGQTTSTPITGAFIFGDFHPGWSQLQGADGSWENRDSSISWIMRFVASARDNKKNNGYDVYCQYFNVGSSQIVPDYNEYAPDPVYKDMFPVKGLFDPFPFPNQNLGGATPGAVMIEYVYGTSSSSLNSSRIAWKAQFGVRADLNTTKGVGPAADYEFKAGPSGGSESSIETRARVGTTMDTAVVQAGDGQDTHLAVSPRGRADGITLPNVKETVALYYIGGERISGVKSPLYSSLVPVPSTSEPESTAYDVYASTPGDLSTYSEASINANMKALYDRLPPDQKAKFTAGYATNYIQDVIQQHAQLTDQGANHLSFRVTASGGKLPDFSQINTRIIESGVAIEEAIYVGVGFGAECSLFGMGEGFSGKVLMGFEFGSAVTSGVTQSKEWGVTARYSYPAEVPGALDYTVQMYICKPSPLWARELQYMAQHVTLGDKVAWEDSLPMKIMFVVSQVSE
jgi:hypothetical protein